ncbi:zinc finger protein 235-like [Topomyia yanbarensis]|uniref:zinc finger protein 235 n=1 Tax=Topomyia yanbarensis TaxID=2498891 RepID=UPI00273B37FB|nr:zinc finger protein 235 [Topomyia yanbarensis]XP_058839765.1 zinc finger protein 235-like [Topomyia yanbarensis]
MGFTDSKMSDLNFLPKKHTNFTIENILLRSNENNTRTLDVEHNVDLSSKMRIKCEQDDPKLPSTLSPSLAPSSSSSSSANQRPMNRVLANPWCSRGPLMFDPKIVVYAKPATVVESTVSAAETAALAETSSIAPSSSSPLIPLIKAEVERKVMLGAYANSSVIERNRLSINYPYPVGFFNAYAAAASMTTHHHQQQQQHQPSVTVPSVLSSLYQIEKSDENQNSIFSATSSASSSVGMDANNSDMHPFFGMDASDMLGYSLASNVTTAVGPFTLGFPEYTFQCQICDKIFGSQDTLMMHEKTHKTPRFECEECGKGFSQLRNYKYHISVHRGTKEFAAKCPECGKIFNDKGYLSSHLKIHRNKKEYSCPHCPKSFNQRVAFNMHVRIHTGVKPHKCSECGKRFSRKMLLKQHLRTHSGEKPYQCSVCGKSFADRSNMTLHHRLHSGIKPFACPICPKAFTKKHHLKTHLNYHTGYKPYKCPHPNCGQTFTQSSNMRTHAKKCQFKPTDG